MGNIFISYSHKDAEYVHRLTKALESKGFSVWIDDRIDYGTKWPHEIQKHLDASDTFIVVMSPNSFESDWVQNELSRAKRKQKLIFPLLLDGNEPWLSVESTHYVDVRDGKLPPARFFDRLANVIVDSQTPEMNLRKMQFDFYNGDYEHIHSADMDGGPKFKTRDGMLYFGAYQVITFSSEDEGRILKIDVVLNSCNRPLWIELWGGVYDGIDPIKWTRNRVKIVRSNQKTLPLLRWQIIPGSYTVYFVTDDKEGKLINYNITYTIDVI